MRPLLFSLLAGSWLGLPLAAGQQPDIPAAPTATPSPAPPATAEPPPYSLDLPDLPPSTGGGLFPSGPRQNPPTPSTGNRSGRNSRGKGLPGGARAHGRALDRTLQTADRDSLDVRVAYRRAKTQAVARVPELVGLVHRADAARTDDEKRACLRQYYTRLFAEVRRIDPSPVMKAHVDLLSQVAAQRYAPNRRVVAGEEDLLNGRDVGRGWLGR